jgi:phage recombination protein Bet
MTALALREDQTYWDENQLAVLQGGSIDEGVTRAELQAFLHECQRRRLDPFTRQIYLIGRWDNQKKRKVYRSQTSIDGFRLIGRRAADDAKESIEYEDTLWCGPDGKWVDVWLADEPPAACKVVVLRNGKRFPATAKFASYVQTNNDGQMIGLWRKMPDGQIGKCTEALALRKAFPEELGGIYAEEEMAQADNPQRVQAVSVEHVPDEPAGPSADQEWLTAALETAATFADDDAGRVLWAELIAKRDDGKIVTADAERLKELIRARWKELAEQAEPVQGTVVPGLDPGDPWAARVEEIATTEDAVAAASEVGKALADGSVDDARAASIQQAIAAREATLSQQAAA